MRKSKDADKEYNKKYWLLNKAKIKKKRNERRKQATEYQQAWYEAHREQWNEYQREYARRRRAKLKEEKANGN